MAQPAPLRIADFFPSKFSGKEGESAYAHWLSYIDYGDIHQHQNNDKLDRFKHTLIGPARLWIENKTFATLNALKQGFIEHFSGVHS